MYVPDPDDIATWTTFWAKIWKGESFNGRGQAVLDYIRDKTTPAVGIFQSAVDWTPDPDGVTADEMKYWIPKPWDNKGGRVTLAGDAAHPMLPCESLCFY